MWQQPGLKWHSDAAVLDAAVRRIATAPTGWPNGWRHGRSEVGVVPVGVVAVGPTRRRGTRRTLLGVVAVAALVLQLATATSAGAGPPPPPNPSNSKVKAAQRQDEAKAGAVGEITSRLSSAQAALQNLSDQVELKQEN